MKCLTCQKEGKKSMVYIGISTSTCMGIQEYYDEEGRYHYHDPNYITANYSCSNGHTWSEARKKECPSCKDK